MALVFAGVVCVTCKVLVAQDAMYCSNKCWQKGLALKFAEENLKASKEVVLAAVKNDGLALEFAGLAMKKDEEVGHAAVRQNLDASR